MTKSKALAIQGDSIEPMADGHMIYMPEGNLAPAIPYDPDIPPAELLPGWVTVRGRLPNGLSRRADLMARLMARGVQAVAAYRAAFNASGEAIRDAKRAWRIGRTPRFRAELGSYRERLQRERRQASLGMREFVLGRLALEAQHASESSARIKALDLLGKSEALWTTVHRTEKTISPKDMQSLRVQLEQRLRDAMLKLNSRLQGQAVAHSHDTGSGQAAAGPQAGDETAGGPHPPGSPLILNGFPSKTFDTIPLKGSPSETHPLESPQTSTPDGSLHREMELEDLGL